MEEQREESASLGDCKAPLEETGVGSVAKDDVEKGVGSDDVVKTDAFTEPETERGEGDAEAVDVKPVNGESHESVGGEVNEVNDEEANCEVEGSGGGDSAAEQNVETEKLSGAEDKAGQKKESGDEDNTNMDVDSKQANEEDNVGSETNNVQHSETVLVPEESTQETKEENPAAETFVEEDTSTGNHKEENGEAMEIDYTEEETVQKVVSDDDAGASMVPTQDVPIAEADGNPSNVGKGMETDVTTDSAKPNSTTEDAAAAPGEVEPLDANGLFDPRSDITSFIDFSGESWSGNIQDLKTESGNVSLKEDKKPTVTAEEVATEHDGNEPLKSVGATANAESRDNAEGVEIASNEAHVATDQQDTRREEDNTTHEAPNIDQNQQEDTVMEENPDNSDSDTKTNGVKRKADVLSEDSLGEGRKTVSLAKVSFAQRPSFKIGACIARAASQMAGSPSVLKGSSLGDETLSVENFVTQLHTAATDPVKENVVSEIATGFFLDFRNSSASQQYVPEKTSSKRGRTSNSNAAGGGTEAFEFEEMGDTYWTDRVIHNGGEEQTPATDKENYQVVPVELKPAQVKRTRRPYRRRQSQISYPLPSPSDKPADFDENAPAELIMHFAETDTIPSEKNLSKMFRHFGPIRDSQTEIDEEKNRARVVFRKGADADVAYKSAAKFNIFGKKTVNYELSFTITEAFKVQPYVVSLGEEEAAVSLPAQM